MALRLNILATAAILIPVAAAAQNAGPATPPPSAQPATPPQSTAPGQTGTTPAQEQTTPGQASDLTPAETGQTPSGQATASGQDEAAAAKPATKADVKAGTVVFDSKGNEVGKIESVSAKGATLNTGKVTVTIPLKSFAHNDKGLVFGMTKAEVEAAAAKQSPNE